MKKIDYLIKESVNAYVNEIIKESNGDVDTLSGYEITPLDDFKNAVLSYGELNIDNKTGDIDIEGEYYGFTMQYTASTAAWEEYDAGDYFTPPSSYIHNEDSFSVDDVEITYSNAEGDDEGILEVTPELLKFINNHADFSEYELEPEWGDDDYDAWKDEQWERSMEED